MSEPVTFKYLGALTKGIDELVTEVKQRTRFDVFMKGKMRRVVGTVQSVTGVVEKGHEFECTVTVEGKSKSYGRRR